MVPLYPGVTTTATLPPLPVDSREQLVYLLTQAAELEQGILCGYLFALYSLKRDPGDGLDPEQLALVTRWGDTLAEIAVQEMLHLSLATNLLTAVGATPHFHRPNFPLRHPGGVPGRDRGRPELRAGPAGPTRLRAPPARPAAGRGHQRPADRAGGRRVRHRPPDATSAAVPAVHPRGRDRPGGGHPGRRRHR